MDKSVVTIKGQIVIPAALRRKYGIKKGTIINLFDRDGEIIIKPVTDKYIQDMAGMTGTRGRLLKAFKKEKAKERSL